MSNSSNSARVSLKSISIILNFSLILLFFSACNLSSSNEPKKSANKLGSFAHILPLSVQDKNSHLIDYQKNKIEKSSTKKYKDSTDLIELALEDQSKPIMTFVQYSY